MNLGFAVLALALFGHDASPEPRLLHSAQSLPVALNPDFQFRKTKLYLLSEQAPTGAGQKGTKVNAGTQSAANAKSTSVIQEASIAFERQYRLFGAVTNLDQRQRFGNYFDFFWRIRRSADVTVRLEYRQEKLHGHVQAQEIACGNVHGSHKSSFKVVGDDYFDGGRVLAWRCLMVEHGKIVAETRSFLWQ